MSDTLTFGAWLKRRRRQLDLTQQELAEQVGCSVGTIRKMEQDVRRPSKQLAELLAAELAILPPQQTAFITFARTEAYTADMSKTLAVLDEVEPEPPPLPTAAAPDPPSPASIRHNLPLQATPFLGREVEIAALSGYLADPQKRLVTIVGPGGMGKTRLALAVADQLLSAQGEHEAHSYKNGVYFVALAPLTEPDQFIPALAEALDFPLDSGQQRRSARQQILDYLRQKEMLLVLDNFEHLLAGVELVADILQSAPQVTILVTSRERLHLHQEQVFALGGLDVPQAEQTEDVAGFTAVQLFLQSARRVKHDFQLNEGEERWLTRICHLVAGMPLAVELAAGWAEMLSLADIAQEIQQSLDFLETDLQNVPSRHRSIHAVFAGSWRRLRPAEKDVFPKLSIFRGGFTRQAAQTITGASLRILGKLVNKSLLQYSRSRDRYFVHELLRQYAAEKLKESGEETAVRDQYSRYYCQVLSEKEPELKSPQRRMAMAEIQTDLANIEDAWRWAVQRRLWPALHQADHTLFWFYAWHFRFQDNLALCQFTVNHLAPGNTAKAASKDIIWILIRVLMWQADSYAGLLQSQRAESMLSQCQTLFGKSGSGSGRYTT